MSATAARVADGIDERIDKLLTQYRESENLKALIRHDMKAMGAVLAEALDLPSRFSIATAVGEQLTFVGKRMGMQRTHCVCTDPLVFGYPYPDDHPLAARENGPIVGYDEGGVFDGWQSYGSTDLTLYDDETFRSYLYARAYQILNMDDIASIQAAARHIWGDQTLALDMGNARVCIVPLRLLSAEERRQVPVAFRILPIAIGVAGHMHYGDRVPFGYGAGWDHYDDGPYLNPERVEPYLCA